MIHVIFGPLSNVMELMPNSMRALKNLGNLTFVKYAGKVNFHFSISEQYIAFEKGIDKGLDNGALNIYPNNRMKTLFKSLNSLNDK